MPKINREEYEILKGLDDDWKWIARDEDRGLYTFTEKPVRNYGSSPYWWDKEGWDAEPYSAIDLFDEKHLFQFIRWEDEKPHNITELIKEYEFGKILLAMAEEETVLELEYESEEAEVKKDIEWLKEELNYFIKFETLDEREIGFELAIREVIDLLSQLDEPEVLSQREIINIVLDDLKEHIKEQQSLSQNVGMAHTPAGNDTHYRQYDYVLECINEYEPSEDLQNLLVPEQEE